MIHTEDSEMYEPRVVRAAPSPVTGDHKISDDIGPISQEAAAAALHERTITAIEITSRVGDISTTTRFELGGERVI